MNSLIDYAQSELDRIEKDKDGMQDHINNHIMNMVKMFDEYGHSGLTAEYTIRILTRLLRWLPLTSLTGEDSEWNKIGGGLCQNNRCFSVFKNKDGRVYDNNAKIISSDGGLTWFSTILSRKDIEFPYFPQSEPERVYIEYLNDTEDYEIITDKPERIKALKKKMMRKDDASEA